MSGQLLVRGSLCGREDSENSRVSKTPLMQSETGCILDEAQGSTEKLDATSKTVERYHPLEADSIRSLCPLPKFCIAKVWLCFKRCLSLGIKVSW